MAPTTPFSSRVFRHCHALRVRQLARRATRLYDVRLHKLGLKVNQLDMLAVIAAHDAVGPGELAAVLAVDVSTLSRNLARMAKRGWITTDWEDDARTRPYRLATKGRRLMAQAAPLWEQAQREAAELLGPAAAALDELARAYWAKTRDGDLLK